MNMNSSSSKGSSHIEDKLASYALIQHRFSRAQRLNESKFYVSHCSRPVAPDHGGRMYYRKSTYRVKNSYQEAVPRDLSTTTVATTATNTSILTTKDIVSIIKDEFKVLESEEYNPVSSPKLAVALSEEIKQRVKERLLTDRYRIVTSVFIVGNSNQELNVASKSLMASSTDTFESYSYSNRFLHAIGIVFLVYLE